MKEIPFLLIPGRWLGEGLIQFSAVKDQLKYYTRWKVSEPDEKGVVRCTQQVEIEANGERVVNELSFSSLDQKSFEVQLQNATIGSVKGTGRISDKSIGWEYRNAGSGFEGFEIYERLAEDRYLMKGEYSSDDESRTFIEGMIWKALEEPEGE